ncbi:protein of unknown function [Methylocaldum szegediense]|uniref:Secreted protein n=1 Tax=Methylocaldum szegediense TaxID=73780 RepID=A0ABM9I9S0_9GAMM|nr:protein of unknown function [Methylocaldum szegediense]
MHEAVSLFFRLLLVKKLARIKARRFRSGCQQDGFSATVSTLVLTVIDGGVGQLGSFCQEEQGILGERYHSPTAFVVEPRRECSVTRQAWAKAY